MKPSIALLLSGLAAQQVAAHWDRQASNYNTPQYNNNQCTDKQKGGYNWGDLNDGDKPGKYDDFDFGSDWSCSTKKFGKRDHVSKRTFGAKAITNKCGKEKPASFSCKDKKDGFSVTHIDVSVDHDAELDFHYKMKDGSICKQRSSCKKEGTTVQNTQCGGAESVDVYLGHSSEGRDDCEIGFHQIGFDCNPGESYTPPPPYTPAPPPSSSATSSELPSTSEVVSTSEVPSTSEAPSTSEVISSSEVPPPSTPTPPPQTSDSPPPPPESSSESLRTPICGYGSCNSGYTNSTAPPTPPETPVTSAVQSTPVESTPVETPSSSAPAESSSAPAESTPPPAESTPSGECGGYGQPACETSTPAPSTPVETPSSSAPAESSSAPAESTPPTESSPVESAPVETPSPSAPAVTTSYNATVPSAPAESQPPTVTPPPGGYTPPECLPKCLNTWLKLKTECKDNTDSACYCKVPDLTDNVIDCVKAYGTDAEVQQALSFFVGICAPQVPQNPGIIDKCTGVPLSPPKPTPTPESPVTPPPQGPATSAAAETPAASAPAVEVPTDVPYTTISYGGSSYTVPQVGFTTESPDAPGANPTEPIALYPAAPTPAPVQAEPTPVAPYPVPSGFTSVALPTGTGALPSAPGQFTGAASSLNVKAKGVGMVAGAILAFFAL